MIKSKDENSKYNKKYLELMESEFKTCVRAFFRYLSYKKKLERDLTLSEKDKDKMKKISNDAEKYFNKMLKLNKDN